MKTICTALGLFVSICILMGEEVALIIEDAVALKTYSGTESILLVWSVPSEVKVESIRVYHTVNLYAPYERIAELEPGATRFNDVFVEQQERYFYRVELLGYDGTIYSSSTKTPPFNRLLVLEETTLDNDTLETYRSINKFQDIFHYAVYKYFQGLELEVDPETLENLGRILLSDSIDTYFWVESIPLADLDNFAILSEQSYLQSLISSVSSTVEIAEPFVCNSLLITPTEWRLQTEELKDHLFHQFKTLIDAYYHNRDYLDHVLPVQVTRLGFTADDSIQVELVVIDPDRLNFNELFLINADEYIDVIVPDTVLPGTVITLSVPEGWNKFDLVHGNEALQTIPSIKNTREFIITFDREYCVMETTHTKQIHANLVKHELWLNELVYSKNTRTLAVEIAGQPDGLKKFGLFLEDSLLWDLSQEHSYQLSYFDSSWTLSDTTSAILWIDFKQDDFETGWIILESRPVFLDRSIIEGRLPDKGPWQEVSIPSLGDSNREQKSITYQLNVPDVFALYQNYPNPFNIGTTITFDLLQPAIVSLYISDARGRIVDQFLEDMNLESGTYQYSWFGEHRSSGIYFFTIQARVGDYHAVVFSRKMIFLK